MFTSLNHNCLNCGIETKFIVIDDVIKAKSTLSFETDLSFNQRIVLNLLDGKKGKVLKKIIK